VHGRDELGSARALVPDVLSAELDGPMPWLLERRLAGTPANAVVDSVGVDHLHHAVTAALQPVYADTVRSVVVDDDLLLEWVDRPLDRICRSGPRRRRKAGHVAGFERLRDDLHERLAGRAVTCSFVHGDLWLGNVLVDPRSADVTALLDWDQAHEPGVPCVDVAHMLLTTRSVELRRPLGRVVLDGIRDAGWSDRDRAVLARLPGGLDELDPKTTILLAWIRHASGLLAKSELYDRSVLWRAQNTELVLEQA
jgi:aminoglycoside phosphotransferase